MIVVIGRVKADAEEREAMIRSGQALAAASRGEAGCIDYRLYEDTENEDEFVFVEEWASDEALKQHFRTTHMAEFMRSAPAMLVAAPDVKFHEIANTRDLSEVSEG
ncbi:MAG: putative quinol monooxygenase [Solirubrobacteraceae bacterium]